MHQSIIMKVPVILVFCSISLQKIYGAAVAQQSYQPYGLGLKGGHGGSGFPAQYNNPKSDAETITHGFNPNINFQYQPQTNYSRPLTPNYGLKSNHAPIVPSYNTPLQSGNQYNQRITENARTLYGILHGPEEEPINVHGIIAILAHTTLSERMSIAALYGNAFKSNLVTDFEEKLSGWFKELIVAIMTPTIEFYAKELYNAMLGAGTDEACLIDILCTLSNQDIINIEHVYQQKYGTSLEQSIEADTSGHFKYLLLSLGTATRDESQLVDKTQAAVDAKKLYDAGKGKWGTDEEVIITILTHRNYRQLRQIADEYQHIAGHTLEKAIEDEFSGYEREGLLTILGMAINPSTLFAERLHASMAGSGTNNKQLIRIVTMRREIDMEIIKMQYKGKYEVTLQEDIANDTSEEYKDCLVALVGQNTY